MEDQAIEWLKAFLTSAPNQTVGVGDDAAVLRLAAGELAITTDMLMDGVDFRVGEVSPERIGHKALAVNLSDLAAMAARPLAAVVSLALPRAHGRELLEGIYRGIHSLSAQFECPIVGGDINAWDQPLAISITALGDVAGGRPLTRAGALPGDAIVVTGGFGFSIDGHHLDFVPRVREAMHLHSHYSLHAGIDASDGLARDLWHLCEASGCGAVIDAGLIPLSESAVRALNQGLGFDQVIDRALNDGEDFELILAVHADEAQRMLAAQPFDGVSLTRIGEFTSEQSLSLKIDGHRQTITPGGYQHRFE